MPRLSMLVAMVLLLLAVGGSARAETLAVHDPVGDDPTDGPVLDITGLEVDNRDHAIVVTTSFVQTGRGNFVVWFKVRSETSTELMAVFSRHRPRRGDISGVGTRDGIESCARLRVRWDDARATVRVRLPSSCVVVKGYDTVRTRVLTELGVDQDFAPQGPPKPGADEPTWRWTRWVARHQGDQVAASWAKTT